MDDAYCSYLATVIAEARAVLTTLNAPGNSLSRTCIEVLSAAFSTDGGMPLLKTIRLADNGLEDDDLAPLWAALSHPTSLPALDVLGLSGNLLSYASIDNSIRAYNRTEVGRLAIDVKNECDGFGQSMYTNASVCQQYTHIDNQCLTTADANFACCHTNGTYVEDTGCSGASTSCDVDMQVGAFDDIDRDRCEGPTYFIFVPDLQAVSDFICLTISFTQSGCSPRA